MAKINWQDIGELREISRDNLNKAIVIPTKEALRQVRFAMGGNLTLKDNQYAAVITFSATHGTEYTFSNPLKTTPIGFTPIITSDTSGAAGLAVSSARLNVSRTDGLLGLTVNYNRTVDEMLTIVKTTNQSITSGAEFAVTFVTGTGVNDAKGDAMSFNGTDGINLNKAGLYQISGQSSIEANATGVRVAYLRIGGARIVQQEGDNAGAANPTQQNLSAVLPVSASQAALSQTLTLAVAQNSGVALNALGAGTDAGRLSGSANRCWLQAVRIKNDETPSYDVTGILWGG